MCIREVGKDLHVCEQFDDKPRPCFVVRSKVRSVDLKTLGLTVDAIRRMQLSMLQLDAYIGPAIDRVDKSMSQLVGLTVVQHDVR